MSTGCSPTPDRASPRRGSRSEEHTSELQSRLHLVCRLLLEKKKSISFTCSLDIPRCDFHRSAGLTSSTSGMRHPATTEPSLTSRTRPRLLLLHVLTLIEYL